MLLLEEERKQRTLQAYVGDVQWSILASIHALSKSKLDSPSYSGMVERLYSKGKPQRKTLSNKDVIAKVEHMLDMFTSKEVRK